MRSKGNGERKRPPQHGQHSFHGGLRCVARLDPLAHQMRNDLSVGLALKMAAACDERITQGLEIFDDAVVHQRHFAGGMGMRIGSVRRAVRRPARMGNAGQAGRRITAEHLDEIDQLALCSPPDELPAIDGANARRIIAAIFHPPQPFDQAVRHG
jgi:hypothetical protein